MKKVPFLLVSFLLFSCNKAKEKSIVAEISCGQCQFELKFQKGCDLAVRVDGKAYFVDGAHIDDFDDAHDKNTGFCEVIRKANIIGSIENNRFKATSIKLINIK